MRRLLKSFLFCVAVAALLMAVISWWFLFYSRDLPDVRRLAQFVPPLTRHFPIPVWTGHQRSRFRMGQSAQTFATRCTRWRGVRAILAFCLRLIGDSWTKAIFTERCLSVQISRTMFCTPSRMLNRQLGEIQTGVRLERTFSRQELFTIYANRVSFGEGLIGIQSASQCFFHKNPCDLGIAEAALLAGLAKAPSIYSPRQTPGSRYETTE